jgi:hypothetical protein
MCSTPVACDRCDGKGSGVESSNVVTARRAYAAAVVAECGEIQGRPIRGEGHVLWLEKARVCPSPIIGRERRIIGASDGGHHRPGRVDKARRGHCRWCWRILRVNSRCSKRQHHPDQRTAPAARQGWHPLLGHSLGDEQSSELIPNSDKNNKRRSVSFSSSGFNYLEGGRATGLYNCIRQSCFLRGSLGLAVIGLSIRGRKANRGSSCCFQLRVYLHDSTSASVVGLISL